MEPLLLARVVVAQNGVVNVHVNAETLYNLEATQRLTGAILGHLGCPTCHSGRQILFLQEEAQFAVTGNAGDIREPLRIKPVKNPPPGQGGQAPPGGSSIDRGDPGPPEQPWPVGGEE
jgi:hypothetical protein